MAYECAPLVPEWLDIMKSLAAHGCGRMAWAIASRVVEFTVVETMAAQGCGLRALVNVPKAVA